MPATVRLGTCSWADEGLLKAWYPRGVSTPQARLRYYAERFDVVEVDSPFYALPDPDVTRRWAERTPDEFTFHVKAGAAMTFHEGEPTDAAFAAFRASVEPLELSGKLRGVLMQYHPRFVKSKEAKDELARVARAARAARAARRVPPPLVDGSGRALRHARLPRGAGARLRVGRRSADARHERRAPRRRRDPPRLGDPLPRPQRADVEHPRRQRRRPLRLAVLRRGARRVGRADAPPRRAGGRGLRALQQQPRRLRAAERGDLPRPARRGGDRGDGWARPAAGGDDAF